MILMIFYNVNLALVCVSLALCNIAIFRFCISKVAIENQKSLLDGGKLVGVEMNGLQAIETLKACGMEDDFFRRWLGFFSKSQNIRQKLEIFRYTLLFVPNFLSFLGSVILLIYGGFLVMKGCITSFIEIVVSHNVILSKILASNRQISWSTEARHIDNSSAEYAWRFFPYMPIFPLHCVKVPVKSFAIVDFPEPLPPTIKVFILWRCSLML